MFIFGKSVALTLQLTHRIAVTAVIDHTPTAYSAQRRTARQKTHEIKQICFSFNAAGILPAIRFRCLSKAFGLPG